jgi:hypothetical protein
VKGVPLAVVAFVTGIEVIMLEKRLHIYFVDD